MTANFIGGEWRGKVTLMVLRGYFWLYTGWVTYAQETTGAREPIRVRCILDVYLSSLYYLSRTVKECSISFLILTISKK